MRLNDFITDELRRQLLQENSTTVVITPSYCGWVCTCDSFYLQSQTPVQAFEDARDHAAIVHGRSA